MNKRLILAIVLSLASQPASAEPSPTVDLDRLIRAAATVFELDEALLRKLIQQESGFNPRAVSHKGAKGLMQLMPTTAADLGVGDAFDPVQNVAGGARLLKRLINRYNGNIPLALAAYNAGEGAVQRHGGIPPYRETQNYVRRIMTAAAALPAPAITTQPAKPIESPPPPKDPIRDMMFSTASNSDIHFAPR